MEKQTMPHDRKPLLSMIFGITAAVLMAAFTAFYFSPASKGMFSEWSFQPYSVLFAVTAIFGGTALTVLAAVFGIIGLVRGKRLTPRDPKRIAFSIVGLCGAATFILLTFAALRLPSLIRLA